MHWQDIPIFINNCNHLDIGFRHLIDWLIKSGSKRIEVIDNASTYPALLYYYQKECPVKVTRMMRNLGPQAFWHGHFNSEFKDGDYYVVTDSDVVPAQECPFDLVEKLVNVFEKYNIQQCTKVGPGIRIDNLPDHYARKADVIRHESQFWKTLVDENLYDGAVDTTFGLYRTKAFVEPGPPQFRLGFPYVIEHRPWYIDSNNRHIEDEYYAAHINRSWSCWSR